MTVRQDWTLELDTVALADFVQSTAAYARLTGNHQTAAGTVGVRLTGPSYGLDAIKITGQLPAIMEWLITVCGNDDEAGTTALAIFQAALDDEAIFLA